MAGEACVSGHKRKGKLSRQESNKSNKDNDIEVDRPGNGGDCVQTRGGVRVYKIVVLGDGGVGKSGKPWTNVKSCNKLLKKHVQTSNSW